MTWRELAKAIQEMTPKQQEMKVTLRDMTEGENHILRAFWTDQGNDTEDNGPVLPW